jgi:hypothetical protein
LGFGEGTENTTDKQHDKQDCNQVREQKIKTQIRVLKTDLELNPGYAISILMIQMDFIQSSSNYLIRHERRVTSSREHRQNEHTQI